MNSNNLLDLVQTGFRVSLGATTAFVETLQDPLKREETLSQLRLELNQRVTEWAAKGEITEQQARKLIDEMLRQQRGTSGSAPATETPTQRVTTPPTTATTPNVQLEIEELTAQIASMRAELEKLRHPGSSQ